MAITQNTFTGNGSNLGPFSFTFKWLEPTDIKVTVAGVLKTAGTHYNLQNLNYTTKNGGQVLFTAGNAPANGAAIVIYRQTDDTDLAATFYSGSAIRAKDLNDNFTQNLYVTQEVNNNAVSIDGSNPMVGNLNMNGFQIDNLAAPTSANDAANKAYVDALATSGGDGDKGDITVSGLGSVFTIDNGAITNAKVNASAGIVSSKLAFTQSGTNTLQRTVESKLQDVVSVKDFGAVGDGVANDTAAIQAALNSARSVFFPRGQYNITSTLIVGQNARLVGELPQSNGQGSPNEVLIYGTVENIGDGNPLVRLHAGTYNANQSVQTRRQSIVIENIAFSSNKSVDFGNLAATTSSGVTGVDVSSVKDGLEFIQCSFSRMAYGIRQYTLEPYLDKVTFSRCHFTLLYRAIECGPTAGLSLDNTWVYDCFDWINAKARNNSIPVPSPASLHSNRGSEVFLNASSFQNSSPSSSICGIAANAITAIGCWFEGGNNWLQPTKFVRAESCYFSEAYVASGDRSSILPAGNSCTIQVIGCRIGTNTRLVDFTNVSDYKTLSITCIGNYDGANFASPISSINHWLGLGIDYEGYGNVNGASPTWNVSQHDRDMGLGKALPEARLHLLKNTAGAGLYVRLTDTSTSGGKAGIIFERTQTNAGDFKVEDVLGELVVSSSNDATTWTDRVKLTSAWAWAPAADNTQSLGTSSLKWSVVYAGTGTINTSDANEKQQIAALTATEQNVAQRLKGLIRTFKFNDAVTVKGDDARIHVGVIAQDVADAFIQEGLDPTRYGIFCKDIYYTLDGVPVVTEGDEPIPDGAIQVERLGIRYEELLAFIIAAL